MGEAKRKHPKVDVPKGLCHYHFSVDLLPTPATTLVREACAACSFFRIVEACASCASSIQAANDARRYRTCQGCGVRDDSNVTRKVIGKV